jgi:NTP pyrophosphatase (non-canonical NTP hydrolase)
MSHTQKSLLTNQDLLDIQNSVVKAIHDNRDKLEPQLLDLLKQVVSALHEIRVTVEFDHEQRLRAIEDFLSQE